MRYAVFAERPRPLCLPPRPERLARCADPSPRTAPGNPPDLCWIWFIIPEIDSGRAATVHDPWTMDRGPQAPEPSSSPLATPRRRRLRHPARGKFPGTTGPLCPDRTSRHPQAPPGTSRHPRGRAGGEGRRAQVEPVAAPPPSTFVTYQICHILRWIVRWPPDRQMCQIRYIWWDTMSRWTARPRCRPRPGHRRHARRRPRARGQLPASCRLARAIARFRRFRVDKSRFRL